MDLRRSLLLPLVVIALLAGQPPASARSARTEHLNRGLVAATTGAGVYLSWRLLGHEATGATATGLTGRDFAIYRNGKRIATVTGSTTYVDTDPAPGARYQVAPLWRGTALGRSRPATAWAASHHDLPLHKPADGVTPAGETYTYRANDVSVGDMDGDGQYEYVVKWDPSNSKDVSQVGYTGPVYLDTYRFDGTLLHRIDLGVNIRAGAHYTQFVVYDLDGDGRAEIMTKTAPGTRMIGRDGRERYITMPREDVRAGYSHSDDYRLSPDGYRKHLIAVFRGWHAHPEVVSGRWPATLEQAFGIEPRHPYPLSEQDAAALVDHFLDVYAPSHSANNKLRQFAGFIVDGPEYLTVFDGATGRELQTVRYEPGRGDDGLMWGDYAMSRIEPGNRVDRFLSGVAYLDGERPSAIFARGYYTRSTVATYDWDGRRLKKRWLVDSGWVPMTNPFRDSPHGRDGLNPSHAKLTTQGSHSLSVADVDGDGRQEIIYGGATLDDDGSLKYSSTGVLPPGSVNPGAAVRVGHGDALHVTDIDPDRPGLEIYMVHEGARSAPYGYAMRDARTGETIYGAYSGMDTGRGMIGDVRPDVRGVETWASMPGGSDSAGTWSADGRQLETRSPGTNMSIRWAGDLTTQIVNGAQDVTPTVDDWRRGTLLTATGTLTNNGTKGNPSLVADVFGDWREELLVRTQDSTALRFYLSTEPTNHKMYTLMHDRQYRVEVARQQTTYNQPSYPSFYFASDVDWSRVPLPSQRKAAP
ncbi:rhamnogalacturonan lyase [Lentzea sp. BCCO 10_0798]|uniref:Rhamnogalacturonan lyase n=1 Tax=Lentzea kristufekii TaxID=3095430 RepID=A0ABU4U5T9_9PSEU|nr:rhamnogalacturonan lyase [Lentzea sp. BCCO 10_0798]MDX8055708.1 rhamnogalacturonan lyase [Lentzea sp. BCCO 10_0798]